MSQKEDLLKRFNEAFGTGDTDFILENVTDNIVWRMAGETTIEGKDNVKEALESMNSDLHHELSFSNIITHGVTAAVNGTIHLTKEDGERTAFEFCDVYKFNKFKDGKIKELTSYVVEMKD
ncbi:nuclear transport factor 2 family protein [Halobacillus sp. Marseille-Q1614]|uniref:nuclear transport factor 2 family protein n=1 Tax=Halobacillus sp. Marseille-Q1614 TaxID=2709134 RepID=UPI00156FBF02|nr:nuclear transport factor 2 family protein [Halobacillus sp. Marseille-Q1614]